jgi:limonene 1,2-monooxygenase
MLQAVEWAGRDAVRRSYELLARYVMPRFQGMLPGLEASQRDVSLNSQNIKQLQKDAIARTREVPAS